MCSVEKQLKNCPNCSAELTDPRFCSACNARQGYAKSGYGIMTLGLGGMVLYGLALPIFLMILYPILVWVLVPVMLAVIWNLWQGPKWFDVEGKQIVNKVH